MVEFGKRLREECARHGHDWERHCIDYGALKRLIEEKDGAGAAVEVVHASADALGAVVLEDNDDPPDPFRCALDREIEKAVLFVLREQGSMASSLDALAARRAVLVDSARSLPRGGAEGGPARARAAAAAAELGRVHGGYTGAARSVLRHVAFVDLNVTAVRKILKKHDKVTGRRLSHSYLSAYSDECVDSHLDQLYHHGGLSSLVATLSRAFEELHRVETGLAAAPRGEGGGDGLGHRRIRSTPMGEEMGSPVSSWPYLDRKIPGGEGSPAANGAGGQLTRAKEPLLQMIQISRDRLKQNTKYVDIVAAQALMFEDDEEVSREDPCEVTRAQRVSSMLNLFSAFLYMTNNYIVVPTCGQYAVRIGSSEHMAGMIIGMSPIAGLIATVLYGWWSNYSYKPGLIFASACSVIGNVAYALALNRNSMTLVIVGRFLVGFGSARAINRRFIADTFSKRDRTAASAAFVSAGALGMACGPALAAMLGHLNYSLDATLWTVETAPGWVMLCLWSVFLVTSVVYFEEPDRSHIFGEKPNSELAIDGEQKHLLGEAHPLGDEKPNFDPPLYANIPVVMTLLMYFVIRVVVECLMSSCAVLTAYYFGWGSSSSGTFLAFLGMLMFPANMVVARLSFRFEDRDLIRYSLIAMLCSITGFIAYVPEKYSVVQYMAFGIFLFVSTNALEGPNMSLLSKTIPRSYAKGIFNTGFLATQTGNAGRSLGDVCITWASNTAGVAGMLNGLFVPLLFSVVLSLALVRRHYDQMVEIDEDDVKSETSKKSDSK